MTKISDLTALTGAGVDSTADLLPIVDMSAAGAARNKKITIDEARIGLGLGTAASPQFTGINLGHASDTTITRASAGVIAVEGVNVVTTAGGVTFAADIIVPDEAYDATAWNASLEVPTKNAVRDKIEDILDGVTFTGDIIVPDEAYDATAWNGSLEVPTKNAVRDKIEAIVAGGGSFTAASTTEVLTGTDTAKGVTPDALAALWEQGSDVASAGTISLGEGGYFNITGTTTITDIDFATDKAGRTAWVKFAGALTLTHNASTLILPTGANITTAAGDTACFVSEGTDAVRCVSYSRASGAALVSGGGSAWTLVSSTSPSGASQVDVTGLGSYNELLVIARALTSSVSGVRAIQVSVDNGSSFDSTAASYLTVSTAGVEANASTPAVAYHATNSTSARTLIAHIKNLKGAVKFIYSPATDIIYVGSSSDINAIRVNNHTGGTISGGPVYVYAR